MVGGEEGSPKSCLSLGSYPFNLGVSIEFDFKRWNIKLREFVTTRDSLDSSLIGGDPLNYE